MTTFECYSFIVLTNLVIIFNFRSSSVKELQDKHRGETGQNGAGRAAGEEPRGGARRAAGEEALSRADPATNEKPRVGRAAGEERQARAR